MVVGKVFNDNFRQLQSEDERPEHGRSLLVSAASIEIPSEEDSKRSLFLDTILDMLLQLHKGSQPLIIASSCGQIYSCVQ